MAKDPLHTKLCDVLGIEFPIVAFTHCKDVAVAAINAGGFAVLGETHRSPDEIAADIKWIRERIGGKPFGIDLVLPASVPPSGTIDDLRAQIPDTHRRFIDDMKRRHNIPEPRNPPQLYQLGWMTQDVPRKQVDVVLEERVPVLAFGLGSPNFIVEAAHSRGVMLWGMVGKPRQAKRELDAGVDAIVAQGFDAGGHTGNIGTFSIVPLIRELAGDKLVIAAGGVTTGRHLAGALALGADGVWCGTVWLASRESDKEMPIKEIILNADTEDAVWSRCISGFTMRTTRSQWHDEWETPGAPDPLPAPYQLLLFAEVQQSVMENNITSFMTEAAGQGVHFVNSMKPVRQIIFDMVGEAQEAFEKLTSDSTVGAAN